MTTGEGPALREEGVPEVVEGDPQDVTLPCTPYTAKGTGAGQPEEAEVMAMSDDEEEVEQGRIPRTQQPPVGMTPAEMRTHSLTHIPFHPACRCCVAGRMKDHQHPMRSGIQRMQDELDSANAHVSAD